MEAARVPPAGWCQGSYHLEDPRPALQSQGVAHHSLEGQGTQPGTRCKHYAIPGSVAAPGNKFPRGGGLWHLCDLCNQTSWLKLRPLTL